MKTFSAYEYRKHPLKILFLGFILLLSACSQTTAPTSLEPQNAYDNILYSLSSTMISPKQLDDAVVSGDIYVWFKPDAPIKGVKFYLDDVWVDGRTERDAPYALNGEVGTELNALDTSTLSVGRHKVVASVQLKDGSTEKWRAYFTVERGDLPSVQAKSAAAFIDTIGVNTHLHYQRTVYDLGYQDIIKPKLLELGVRHVRDRAYTYPQANRNTFYYQRLRELAEAGIRFNLLTSLDIDSKQLEATDYSKLADVVACTNGAIESFEGINEPDLEEKELTNWISLTRKAQETLFATIAGNEVFSGIKVLGPSPVWQKDTLGDLSRYMDYGNIHPYPGGKMPTGSEGAHSTVADINAAAQNSGDKPVVITETGYHNALNANGTHPPTSEEASAKYLPRLLLEHFNMGVPRTYLYEFIDSKEGRLTDKEASFGLLRNDGSEKPAYTALKNLIGLLEDTDTDFAPGSLSFSLSGATQNVHHTLLQKRDGSLYLALWLEQPSWDRHASKPISVPTQNITVTFASSVLGATLHSLNTTGIMSHKEVSLQNRKLELDVSDSVAVLELRP